MSNILDTAQPITKYGGYIVAKYPGWYYGPFGPTNLGSDTESNLLKDDDAILINSSAYSQRH